MNVFISCTANKNDYTCKAIEMYEPSVLFRKRLEYVNLLSKIYKEPIYIYILSAKYGLLKPDDIIETYDLCLNNSSVSYRKEWVKKVLLSINENKINKNDKSLFLAGRYYCKGLVENFTNVVTEYELVTKKMKGGTVGYILQYYDLILSKKESRAIPDNPRR